MKYIRTKDGIITDKLYEQALEICALTYENAQKTDLKVINQDDTIEDLCDEFVCVHKENDNKTVHKSYWFAIATKEECKQIYGAIWTDKGLIYVAKMNDKGELELL